MQKTTKFRIALCQMKAWTDKAHNLSQARASIMKAKSEDPHFIVLPECFNSPYDTKQFAKYSEKIPDNINELSLDQLSDSPSVAFLKEISKETATYLVGGSIPEVDEDGKVFNTCMVFSPQGKLITKHRKVHLFDIDVPGKITFKESDSLTAGDQITTFESEFCTVGVGICYDIRFPEYAQLLQKAGAKLMIFPGCFNTTTGPAHWELLIRTRALDNEVYFAACSQSRFEEEPSAYQAFGHSTVADPWGKIVTTTEHQDDVIFADIDLEHVDYTRESLPYLKQKRDDLYGLSKK